MGTPIAADGVLLVVVAVAVDANVAVSVAVAVGADVGSGVAMAVGADVTFGVAAAVAADVTFALAAAVAADVGSGVVVAMGADVGSGVAVLGSKGSATLREVIVPLGVASSQLKSELCGTAPGFGLNRSPLSCANVRPWPTLIGVLPSDSTTVPFVGSSVTSMLRGGPRSGFRC
jgi:hypothetical protein